MKHSDKNLLIIHLKIFLRLINLVFQNNAHCLEEVALHLFTDEKLKYLPLCHNLKKFYQNEYYCDLTSKTLECVCKAKKLECFVFNAFSIPMDADVYSSFFNNAEFNLKELRLVECDIDDTTLAIIASK
jgi:hypothetical protein